MNKTERAELAKKAFALAINARIRKTPSLAHIHVLDLEYSNSWPVTCVWSVPATVSATVDRVYADIFLDEEWREFVVCITRMANEGYSISHNDFSHYPAQLLTPR
ncbi:MAG: hypothetical protein A3I07_01425 [Candidatus Doudnabacteria bacterium RIFCSPLOWO2_02_FULL_42_9]|nr:MAG: hypothetical protein A3E28_00985 [Candidatus Doudnabacteria bacterium RIFCSPHIGHO2_12_FULL_42_22]OGE86767.1 MAG: hypothetical protein A3C49_01820 [Candidatus Doudnabacteria bacterium RIFCSPHIGHO2_02_FULL_42_25]OGE92365.1 MAG: hypothetical protein A2895_01975 [Candidatus Doudnabacteria bacterium RIFCSPLOWO2_01_FULL_42_60]OGE92991.1 MAG: hypothetical protein A3K08_00300 [Candidatus Doudnabacteria bacterium RIFCSPLOWO2_01_41_7]OGE98335.1 MAG: hypothetical protein A3G89_01450 [Candidatus Do